LGGLGGGVVMCFIGGELLGYEADFFCQLVIGFYL